MGLQTLWDYSMRRPWGDTSVKTRASLASWSLLEAVWAWRRVSRGPVASWRSLHTRRRQRWRAVCSAATCFHALARALSRVRAALHVHPRGCMRDSRARWRSAMPVLCLPSARIVARGCQSHPSRSPSSRSKCAPTAAASLQQGQPQWRNPTTKANATAMRIREIETPHGEAQRRRATITIGTLRQRQPNGETQRRRATITHWIAAPAAAQRRRQRRLAVRRGKLVRLRRALRERTQ